jgi:glucokinase
MSKLSKFYSIGIDVGGTKLSGVLFDGKKILADLTLATPKDNLSHFLIMIKALADPLIERAKKDKIKIAGLGLGIPGVIDKDKKIILKCPNLPLLDRVNLISKIKESLELKTAMDNDANCFVRAEALKGAGKNYKNIFGLTIGTGIGGGWWKEGEIYSGSHGGAGEAGHMIINFESPIDWEKAYHKLTQGDPAQLAEEAFRGDILAEKIYEEIGEMLGLACANIVNLIDPEIIIVGGGVLESSDLFLNFARKIIKKHIINPEAQKIKISKGKFGQLAGAVGAALLISSEL